MNVLDIDIDVFVDPLPWRADKRLPAAQFQVWSTDRVRDFVQVRCGLRAGSKVRGQLVKYHHELFDVWKSLISAGMLTIPFHLTHVDSHADMGMGDTSCNFIMGELMHKPLAHRCNPPRNGSGGLLEGNFLSFAIANNWLSSIEYVHHPDLFENNGGLHDIPNCMFENYDPRSGVIQLKKLPRNECLTGSKRMTSMTPIELGRPVPISFACRDTYSANRAFDFAFAARSPNYTPSKADELAPVVQSHINSL